MDDSWHERARERAWAAGFFDGEGCFASQPSGYPMAVINQTDREVLDRFQIAVGGAGKVYGPYDRGKWSAMWCYQAVGRDAVAQVFTLLQPYLSSIKREQGQRVLATPSRCRNGHEYLPGFWCPVCILNKERQKRGLPLISDYSYVDGILA